MKILFISPRPFGLMGTPGTYLLVDAYAKIANVSIIANKEHNDPFRIVYSPPKALKLHEILFNSKDYLENILQIATSFEPDIVNIASHPGWTDIVDYLKANYPTPIYVFDIKSPLLSPLTSETSRKIGEKGRKSAKSIDLVVTRSRGDVFTWIPQCVKPALVYPLGVRLSDYSPRFPERGFSRCTRFVYSGAIAPLRKLDTLLEYIAALPQDIKENCTFDFFGSGPAEESFIRTLHNLDLKKIVTFKGCVDTEKLPGILTGYDAGIAWVPRSLYDDAPSLKMVEYIAAGLLPIATNTTAHKRYAAQGFTVKYFSETPNSFANTIADCLEQGFSSAGREKNLEKVKAFDWDNVVQDHIFPAFREAIIGKQQTSINLPTRASFMSKKSRFKNLSKILFISPRPFGLMGTPGTYHLVDAYARFADVRVIANKVQREDVDVVYKAKNVKHLVEMDIKQGKAFHRTISIVQKFKPEVVIIGNSHRWYHWVRFLKNKYPKAKYVLDIKSPLITPGNKTLFAQIQHKGQEIQHDLDLVMTRCQEDVDSWIPDFRVPVLEYPLGIKLEEYSPKHIDEEMIRCHRFVYIGSIHPLRKIDKLIKYISELPEDLKQAVTFDFYGSGAAVTDFDELVSRHNLHDAVFFKGCLNSTVLSTTLAGYDAGIAWVPHEKYEYAPSLKLVEYLASGLVPLAMDTAAHLRHADQGFHVKFFTESSDSFSLEIKKVCEEGFPSRLRTENLKRITNFDWGVIASTYILPAFEKLIEKSPPKTNEKTPINKRIFQSTFMNKASISQRTMENLHIWCHSFKIPEPKPVHDTSLRIAGILGHRLTDGLRYECTMLMLLPKRWKQVLKYGKPDILLVESTWFTATGHWYMAQSVPGDQREELDSILELARKLNIPTVFWFTLDSQYHEYFVEFARHFDRVYCVDPKGPELMARDGVRAEILLPAVQPVLFNPIHNYNTISMQNAGIVYDGWYDLFKYPELNSVISKFKEWDLNIIESAVMMYKVQLKRLHDNSLIPFVRGIVNHQDLPAILKHASTYLSCTKTASTQTRRVWTSLEAAACRLPIAHLGSLESDDLRNSWVHCCGHEDEYVDYVKRLREDVLLRERQAHKAWRIAFKEHTLSKRLQTICSDLDIQLSWEEFPRATMVTGTMREHLLPKCFKQFEEQTYPNKELILIFNGDRSLIDRFKRKYADNPDIVVTSMPQESAIGTILNFGAHKATGSYFFRIDDDDHYAPDYIHDSMLYLRAMKVDILGKRASFFHFEDETEIYLRKGTFPVISKFPARLLHQNDDFLISGCSFGAEVSFLRKHRYPDFVQASADTALIDSIKENSPKAACLLIDNLNLVAERLVDVSNHTWRIAADHIKDNATVIATSLDEVMG